MTTAVQHRRGTTAEHSTFTGLEGEVTIDTTKDTAVIHDGVLAGGYPLAKETLANVNPTALTAITGAATASDDLFMVYDASTTSMKKITRAELNNAMEADALANVSITGGTINGTTIGGTTAAAGSFTTLSASEAVTLSAGTANGVAYLNGSKVLTSGSALTFDGANLDITGALTVSGNTILGDASTDTVQVNGYMGVRATPAPYYGIVLGNSSAITGDANPRGISSSAVYGSDATGIAAALFGQVRTTAAAYTMANAVGVRLGDASKGAGSTITNQHGVYIADQTQGTNNYGITSLVSSGTNKWNIYASGTAANYFAGNVGIGTTSPQKQLEVKGSSATSEIRLSNSTAVYSNIYSDSNGILILAADGGGTGGAASMRMSVSGSERLRIDSSGNVGIGTSSPSSYYANNLVVAATSNGGITVASSTTSDYAWLAFADGVTGNERYRGMVGYHHAVDALLMYSSGTERLRIDSSGNVGIGTSSPAGKFEVTGSVGSFYIGSTGNLAYWTRNGANYLISNGSGSHFQVWSPYITFWDASGTTQRVRIDSDGLKFNGDTAAANALDDYEEGTWTPTFVAAAGSFTTLTYNTVFSFGTYTKIGNMVTVRGYIRTEAVTVGTASGQLFIGNLPFTVGTSGSTTSKRSVGACKGGSWASNPPGLLFLGEGDTKMSLLYWITTGTINNGSVTPSNMATGSNSNIVEFTASYTVN